MPHEVKMPQLGMAQDAGVIVAWLKGHGDPVAIGDPIFEVETDKATMEVEAAADGFLAGVRAAEGADVPVGDVIALIVETQAELAEHASHDTGATAVADTSHTTEPAPVEAKEEPSQATSASVTASPTERARSSNAPAGKVLASPKARRLAAERGIDLALLRAQGVREPIHSADLPQASHGGLSVLTARVDGGALNALLERSAGADRTQLFAAFAAGAWCALFAADHVMLAIWGLDGTTTLRTIPERGEASAKANANANAVLSLVDFCDTRISGYAPAGGLTTLSVAKDGDAFALTLAFSEVALPMPHGIALLDEIAARVEDPIRQLL